MSLHLGYLNLVLLVQVTTYIVYDVWSSFQVFFMKMIIYYFNLESTVSGKSQADYFFGVPEIS